MIGTELELCERCGTGVSGIGAEQECAKPEYAEPEWSRVEADTIRMDHVPAIQRIQVIYYLLHYSA